MVVNLCLPHFQTTVHCNKLCADGYDVTNLVSADPALRRRGFKLEYFLRPPVQVTLKFGFQVELCRVDVELWPWGMDRGQACKRLEISTSSDRLPPQNFDQSLKQAEQKAKDPNKQNRGIKQEDDGQSQQSNGHQWSRQAQQWGEDAGAEPQRSSHKSQSNTESSHPEAEFKLVGRCELREETQVCFARSNCRPRPPFPSPPPPPPEPASCRQEELWSRGLLSLGAVTQLRVTVPFGGAASALGLKALAVWGQPARCCSAEEVERIRRIHEAGERKPPRPALFASTASQTKPRAATPPSSLSIPEEFLDPITQEVMLLPMLLPSGVSVDTSTLEEHQKREATWGRPPNDPFTGVPFTSTSQPLPNPQLKTRIDHFLLQKGMIRRDGAVGRRGEGENPQASRLLDSKVDGQSLNSQIPTESLSDNSVGTVNTNRTGSGRSTDNGSYTSNPEALTTDCKSETERQKKRDLSGNSTDAADASTAEQQQLPRAKRPKNDSVSIPSCSSHEQRLSASLDEALFSALQGRPSFTSNLTQQRRVSPDSEQRDASQRCQKADNRSAQIGEKRCSACSCSVSVYSKYASSIYRLTCGHLLCRSCLRRDAQPPDAAAPSTSNHISCPACQSPTPRSDITRVHH